MFLSILSISQVADTNTARNVQKQDLSMILIQLLVWKCNKVNKGQRLTFLMSLLNVLYFWNPWVKDSLRSLLSNMYECDELANAIGQGIN